MSRLFTSAAALLLLFWGGAYGTESSVLPNSNGASGDAVVAGGEGRVWRFEPEGNFYVRISASAPDASLTLRLRDATNKLIQESATIGGTGGRALLAWISAAGTSYSLEVSLAGSYPSQATFHLIVEEYRPAAAHENPQDLPLLQAAAMIARARKATAAKHFDDSTALFQQVLQFGQQLSDSRVQSQALYGLGMAHYYAGDPQQALPYLQHALALRRADNQIYEIALTLNNLAAVEQVLGSCREAVNEYGEALRLREIVHDQRGSGYTLLGLANASYCVGDTQQALESGLRARAIWRGLKDDQNGADTLNTLGVVYLQMGDRENSRQALEAALALWRRAGNRLGEGNSTYNLALLETEDGRSATASERLQKALSLFRGIQDQRGTAYVLEAVAQAYGKRGLHSEALDTFQESRSILEKIGDRYEQGYLWQSLGNEYSALDRSSDARNSFGKALELESQVGDAQGRAITLFRLAQLEKQVRNDAAALGNVNEAIAAIEQSRKQVLDPAHRASYVATKREMYAFKVRLLIDSGDQAGAFETSDAAHARSLLDEVSLPDQIPALAKLADIQHRLDRDSTFIEYLVRNDASYGWAITANAIAAFTLPPRSQMDEICRQLYQGLTARNKWIADESLATRARRVARARLTAARAEARLNDVLLAAIPPALRKRQMIIVADGPLYSVPLSVLPLARRADLMETPSAAIFLAGESRHAGSSLRPALVIADPTTTTESLAHLQYSTVDAAALKRAFKTSDLQMIEKNAATTAALKNRDLSEFGLIHIAAHAIVDISRPERSGIVLSDGKLTPDAIRKLAIHARLVTLSACETARGKEIEGEGLMSLSRAFLDAGASAVLSTLWPVDDQATARFMDFFYTSLLQQGMNPSAALLRAQLQMQATPAWSDPFYWAAFTLHADRLN